MFQVKQIIILYNWDFFQPKKFSITSLVKWFNSSYKNESEHVIMKFIHTLLEPGILSMKIYWQFLLYNNALINPELTYLSNYSYIHMILKWVIKRGL